MKVERVRQITQNAWVVKTRNGFRYAIYGDNGEFMAGGESYRDSTDAIRGFRDLLAVAVKSAAEFSAGNDVT